MFHVSMLQKYQHDLVHIIHHEILQLKTDLTYEEKSICILEQQKKKIEESDDTNGESIMAAPL